MSQRKMLVIYVSDDDAQLVAQATRVAQEEGVSRSAWVMERIRRSLAARADGRPRD